MHRNILRFTVVALSAMASLFVAAPMASAQSCRDGGTCKVGDIGPGGGIVFYDAGSLKWWGQYLEFKGAIQWRVPWSPSELAFTPVYSTSAAGVSVLRQRVLSKAIGYGKLNTATIINAYGNSGDYAARVASRVVSPKSDWYLPSKDEANVLYNYLKLVGKSAPNATVSATINRKFTKFAMWTSSEAGNSFAWFQLFVDGTQYTDANGIISGLSGNKTSTVTRQHGGSFLPMPLIATPIRAFPESSGAPTADPVGEYPIGATGPGGGIVFYDAGSHQSWGRYLEVAPLDCEGVKLAWKPNAAVIPPLYVNNVGGLTAARKRVLAKALGAGKANTVLIVSRYKAKLMYAARYAQDLVCHDVDDWFLPSKDELDLVFNNLKALDSPLGGFDKGYYWTSSEYDNQNTWTEYFTDGQQFDRIKTLSANKLGPQRPFRVRPIRAFG
ncbi:MAG: hypothetical protein ACYC06_09595 [Ilumatobacteraceae bacterium]